MGDWGLVRRTLVLLRLRLPSHPQPLTSIFRRLWQRGGLGPGRPSDQRLGRLGGEAEHTGEGERAVVIGGGGPERDLAAAACDVGDQGGGRSSSQAKPAVARDGEDADGVEAGRL